MPSDGLRQGANLGLRSDLDPVEESSPGEEVELVRYCRTLFEGEHVIGKVSQYEWKELCWDRNHAG